MFTIFRRRLQQKLLASSQWANAQRRTPFTFVSRSNSQFKTTPMREKNRTAVGVFTPKAAAIFVATGIGLYFYFQYEKAKVHEQRQKEQEAKQIGRAHVGGPFSLTSHYDKTFSEQDLLGRWNLIYFGFTNCPDICPAELDKMSVTINTLEKEHGAMFQPIFISVDPARDSIPQVARYLTDFHPRFIGLVGDYNSIKSVCKAYRVYFSTPPNADPNGDYLVDHSIYIYLMDPKGEFVKAFGQVSTVDEIVSRVQKEMELWTSERKLTSVKPQ